VTLKKPVEAKKTSSKEPQTMEELLASSGYQIKGLKKGQPIEGTVKNIASKAIYFDIGYKTDGIVMGKEFEMAKDFIRALKPGDKVMMTVYSPEDPLGQTLLSIRKAAFTSAWKKYFEVKAEDGETEVMGKESTGAGLLVEAEGLSGFIPVSQFSKNLLGKMNELVGKKIKVKVLEIDSTQNRLIFSEKAVSEKEKIAKIKKLLEKVKGGELFNGEVTSVVPFGLFVKIALDGEEVEGLVHVSEIAWEKTADPSEIYKVGDKVSVVILSSGEGRLSFSLKQTTNDPWQEKVKKYEKEKTVKGKVIRLVASGAIIELEGGLEGLLHISKIPPTMKIDVGDTIDTEIEKIEADKRKISLGLVLKAKPMGYK
jgi:small subunit ribosomal protein S1